MFSKILLFVLLFASAFFASGQQDISQQRAEMEALVSSGNYTAALKKALEIKKITEKKFGSSHVEHAQSVLDVAVVYYYLFDCSNSELNIEAAKNIYAKTSGIKSYAYANALQNQSYIFLTCNKPEKAEEAATQAIKIIQENVSDSTRLLATLYSDLGYVQTTLGKIPDAKRNYDKSYSLMNRYGFIHGEEYAFLLNNIASFYHDLSDYASAKKYYDESLLIHKKVFGSDAPEYATVLNNEGILDLDFGYYEEGAQLIFKAAAIYKNTKGEKSLEYARSMNDIGNVYDKESDYKNAEQYYLKALQLKKELGVEGNVTYWNTLNNLALLYARLGNYSKAISTMQGQLELIKKYGGQTQPEYGNYLNSMGAIYEQNNDYTNASVYFNQALQFYKTYYGVSDPNYSRVLNNLGLLAVKQGKTQLAFQYYNQSVAILERDTIANQIEIADTYNNMGELHSETGDFTSASVEFQKALRIYDSVLGKKHPSYWITYSNDALLQYRSGNTNKAIQQTRQVLDMNLSMVYDNFTFLSEAEKLKYWNKTYDQFEFYNSMCVKEYAAIPELIGSMYNYSLATKSLVFNYTNQLKSKILQHGNKELLKEYVAWENKKQLLATYYNFSKQQLATNNINLPALESEVNLMEKNIVLQSAAFKIARDVRNITWKDIQAKLKENEAAVQMLRVKLYNNVWTDSIVYVALILTKETVDKPIMVVLKNGNKLEKKYYNGFFNAIQFDQVTDLYYTVFWKEIDQHILNKTTVYVSPAGVYNKISLPALKLPDGSYLLEKRNIQIVPVMRSIAAYAPSNVRQSDKAFLFGHPNYNYTLPADTAVTRSVEAVQPLADELRGTELADLPGTKIEVDNISGILNAYGIPVNTYTGNNASETEIKKLVNPSVLHIATHGYFIKNAEIEEAGTGTTATNYKENPWLRSGILLAGSNYTLNNQSSGNPLDDGILTAYEAMQLNLDRTDLVILSACETGLGEVMNSEGVIGLQRSFMLAGADNMLMSLWQVNDEGTQSLMSNFYKYWVVDRNSGIALRRAQLDLMKTHPSPYYWAPFVYIR
jgi:CHAT domain-containing protein/Tfp pilus assembly protein PilF